MRQIPYGTQSIDEQDIKEVLSVLRSGWITQGPKIAEFEAALCNYTHAKYAVAVSSGTAGLHLACLAAGIGKGDEVITSPITFVASANCVLYCAGTPVFVDIDPVTINISPENILRYLQHKNIQHTTKVKAIIPVHFAGNPCDMEGICALAKKNDLIVIEDACHALGAQYQYKGRWIKVGSCKHSDMAVFSFHPVKHITTGEGGAITTNNKKLYERLMMLRTHGIQKTKSMTERHGQWYYQMTELGFNYRITDIQCALGASQLKRIDTFLKRRRAIAAAYDEAFSHCANIKLQAAYFRGAHAYHIYVLKINFKNIGMDRQELVKRLKDVGIGTQVHYIPVYRQPYYREKYSIDPKKFPNAEHYYQHALTIPLYPAMRPQDITRVISAIKRFIV